MKKIITISREYGSGGREIGQALAERFGIPFYDKDVAACRLYNPACRPKWSSNRKTGFPEG